MNVQTSCWFGMEMLMSYQGIHRTAFADAHLFINNFKVFIQRHTSHASFEWLYGDVMSGRRSRKIKLFSLHWEKADRLTHNAQ